MSSTDPLQARTRWPQRLAATALLAVIVVTAIYRDFGRDPAADRATTPGPATAAADGPGAVRPAEGTRYEPASAAAFDFYVLAMSLAPAFCDDGHTASSECRGRNPGSFARVPLTLHGLWPERRTPDSYPQDCGGRPFQIGPGVRARMQRLMPGAASGLDRYEWRKHGTCTGRPANEYFSDALDRVEQVDAALGPALAAAAGTRMSAAQLRATADVRSPGIGAHLVFVCKNLRSADPAKRQRPYLYEVRLCASREVSGRVSAPLDCARVGRSDQGCGADFWIDSP